MRNRFDEQLELLNREMTEMGAMCETLIEAAIKGLMTGDTFWTQQVKAEGYMVDEMERSIESRCMKLLLHQQPVAKDLRQISAALKMITDMERIGDQAEDIAEISTYIKGHSPESMGVIGEMAQATIQMVTGSIDAYVRKDIRLAEKVIARDDSVDEYFIKMKKIIIKWIADNPEDGEFALDLLMIAKYLERIGDHATNIAEWVIYSLTGHHKEAKSE